jgi:hypothetical protein
LFLFPTALVAQDSNKILTAYFVKIRSGEHIAIPKSILLPQNAKATLSLLSPYFKDTATVVRLKAYSIAQLAGSNALQPAVREDAVTKLVEGVKDKDSGNVGIALGYLTAFRISDFDKAAKDTLANVFKRKSPHFDKLIRLTGYIQLTNLRDDLRTLSQNISLARTERWAALLALARMGDNYAIDDVMTRVQKLPVNDEVIYQVYPDLVYARQQKAFDVLLKALNSDEKNCESANMEVETKIPCAYRIMEMLAPAIQGYPLKLDESGDIDAENYEGALRTVRDWFKANSNYTIITNTY